MRPSRIAYASAMRVWVGMAGIRVGMSPTLMFLAACEPKVHLEFDDARVPEHGEPEPGTGNEVVGHGTTDDDDDDDDAANTTASSPIPETTGATEFSGCERDGPCPALRGRHASMKGVSRWRSLVQRETSTAMVAAATSALAPTADVSCSSAGSMKIVGSEMRAPIADANRWSTSRDAHWTPPSSPGPWSRISPPASSPRMATSMATGIKRWLPIHRLGCGSSTNPTRGAWSWGPGSSPYLPSIPRRKSSAWATSTVTVRQILLAPASVGSASRSVLETERSIPPRSKYRDSASTTIAHSQGLPSDTLLSDLDGDGTSELLMLTARDESSLLSVWSNVSLEPGTILSNPTLLRIPGSFRVAVPAPPEGRFALLGGPSGAIHLRDSELLCWSPILDLPVSSFARGRRPADGETLAIVTDGLVRIAQH